MDCQALSQMSNYLYVNVRRRLVCEKFEHCPSLPLLCRVHTHARIRIMDILHLHTQTKRFFCCILLHAHYERHSTMYLQYPHTTTSNNAQYKFRSSASPSGLFAIWPNDRLAGYNKIANNIPINAVVLILVLFEHRIAHQYVFNFYL